MIGFENIKKENNCYYLISIIQVSSSRLLECRIVYAIQEKCQQTKDLKSNFVVIISWNLNHVEIVEKNYGKMKEYVLSVDEIEDKMIQNNKNYENSCLKKRKC